MNILDRAFSSTRTSPLASLKGNDDTHTQPPSPSPPPPPPVSTASDVASMTLAFSASSQSDVVHIQPPRTSSPPSMSSSVLTAAASDTSHFALAAPAATSRTTSFQRSPTPLSIKPTSSLQSAESSPSSGSSSSASTPRPAAVSSEVSTEDLLRLLETQQPACLLVLDVRSFFLFNRSHLRDSINVCVADPLVRRQGFSLKVIEGFIPSVHKGRFRERVGCNIVLYDDLLQGHHSIVLVKIAQKLCDEGIVEHVYIYKHAYQAFAASHPDWTVNDQYVRSAPAKRSRTSTPTLGTGAVPAPSSSFFFPLPQQASASTQSPIQVRMPSVHSDSDACKINLVQVLDWLYIGDDEVAADEDTLERTNIHYILNAARECSNHFQHKHEFQYLRMDLADNPDQQCLLSLFEEACNFIDRGHAARSSVLVHCRAGRSRSATVVIAYLMKRMHWSLDYAYDFLRKRRPNICPNLGFMGLLLKLIPTCGSFNNNCLSPSLFVASSASAPLVSSSSTCALPALLHSPSLGSGFLFKSARSSPATTPIATS